MSTFVATGLATPVPPKKRFLDRCRDVARYRQLSRLTEECYVRWIRQFILHHGKRHPREMGPEEIRDFLTALAVQQHVAACDLVTESAW